MLLVTVAAIEVKYICKRNSCIRIFTTSGSSTLYVKFKHDPANLQALEQDPQMCAPPSPYLRINGVI